MKIENSGICLRETEIFRMLDNLLDMLGRVFEAEGPEGAEALAAAERISAEVHALDSMREAAAE